PRDQCRSKISMNFDPRWHHRHRECVDSQTIHLARMQLQENIEENHPHNKLDNQFLGERPGPFPIDALSPVIRDIAQDAADVYRSDVAMAAIAALAIHAGAMGKQYRLKNAVNGLESYGNLYVAISAPRGAGKSCISVVLAVPFFRANETL